MRRRQNRKTTRTRRNENKIKSDLSQLPNYCAGIQSVRGPESVVVKLPVLLLHTYTYTIIYYYNDDYYSFKSSRTVFSCVFFPSVIFVFVLRIVSRHANAVTITTARTDNVNTVYRYTMLFIHDI